VFFFFFINYKNVPFIYNSLNIQKLPKIGFKGKRGL